MSNCKPVLMMRALKRKCWAFRLPKWILPRVSSLGQPSHRPGTPLDDLALLLTTGAQSQASVVQYEDIASEYLCNPNNVRRPDVVLVV